MSTTIDKLQIEIESTSGNAAKGIDDLAKSLSALKKSGTISVAVKNLNNLSDALHRLPNVHPASNALRTLANSIEKLKGVGSISGTVTSLTKLPSALKSLANINLDNVAPKIRQVADAMSPLASVKAGGLGTLVNGLSRLDKVTESLDDATISRFAAKVELLTQKLGPLSEKMTSIKAGFSSINSAARTTTVNIDKLGDQVNVTTLNFANMVTSIQGVVSAFQPLIQLLIYSIKSAMEWDGIKYQFGNAFGDQADEYYEKITKITDALYINKQAFMENSAMATSMLVGFGVDKTDAREMGVGYTELAYDIWAAFNNVYQSLDGADGAMAAVRSAIAGEVEPIRRAGFTIVDSQLAITAANHGLAYSTTEATEAQKSYLRYLTLVDQAQSKGIVGTYAREMETAEGMMRQFSQQLKSLSQAFGSLFLPILVKVMPYLQAFVELLADGVRWVAALFGIEIQDIGDTWTDYSSGIKDAATNTDGVTDSLKDATKAAKELKHATIGIDELNVISANSASSDLGGVGGSGADGTGGGYSGLNVGSLWDQSIFDDLQQDVDTIKKKMEDWLPVIATVTGAIAGIRLINLLADVEKLQKLKIVAFFTDTAKSFKSIITNITEFIAAAKLMAPEVGWLAALFPKLSGWLSSIGGALAGISAPVWAAIAAAIVAVGSAIYFVAKNWDEFKAATVEFFKENIAPKLQEIVGHLEKMGEALAPVWDLLKPIFDAVVNFFKSIDWASVGGAILKFFEGYGALLVGALGARVLGAITACITMWENLIQTLSGVIQIVRGVVDVIIAVFTGGDIEAAFGKIVEGVKDVWDGIVGFITEPVVNVYNSVVDWFTKMWDILVGHSIVPDTVDAIVDCFASLPTRIWGLVESFVTGIVDRFSGLGASLSEKFSSAWEAVKTWWNKKTNLSTYTPTIGNIKDKLSSAWTTAKNWWDETKATLSTYTPTIGSIKDNLSNAWTVAKGWWDETKSNLSTYTPSIGSIKDKLSSAWTTAKNWWDKTKSNLSTYTPTIGSIKDKLSSAWTTAKNWWSNSKSALSYTPTIGSIKDKLSSAWTTAKTWWSKTRSSLSYTPTIGSIKDKLSSAWSTAKTWWNNNVKLSIPSMSFKVTYSNSGLNVAQKAIIKALDLDGWPKLSFAANGGIFDQGSLIWAGERGPEVMATAAGGKTGVMNVQQMQDAVYEGVYAAMSAAMRGSNDGGGGQSVNIYLDGRQITAAVEKRQRERGASILGNEVYSY